MGSDADEEDIDAPIAAALDGVTKLKAEIG